MPTKEKPKKGETIKDLAKCFAWSFGVTLILTGGLITASALFVMLGQWLGSL